jgi:hypothetical protein
MSQSLALFAAFYFGGQAAEAAFVDPGLSGNTQYDGWFDLSAAGNPGYPGYPGTKAWPAPIGSNAPGSGDATLDKTANGIGGGPYPYSGGAIYHGGTSSKANTLGGSLAITDLTPVADLKVVVFQIKMTQAYGYDFYSNIPPVLSYNGGAQALAPTVTSLTSQVQTGTFTDPGTGSEQPVFTNEWFFQWDLTSVVPPITDFSVGWSSVQHSLIYALQLNQGDVYPVPEPSTVCLAAMGGLAVLAFSRKRWTRRRS